MQADLRVVVTGYEEMTAKVRRRVRVAVEVRDAINDLSLLWPDLGLLKEPFDTDVVVSREDKDRDAAPDRIEDTRDLCSTPAG